MEITTFIGLIAGTIIGIAITSMVAMGKISDLEMEKLEVEKENKKLRELLRKTLKEKIK